MLLQLQNAFGENALLSLEGRESRVEIRIECDAFLNHITEAVTHENENRSGAIYSRIGNGGSRHESVVCGQPGKAFA